MAKDKQDNATQDEAAPKKSPVMLIVVMVNVLAIGGAAAYFLTRPANAGGATPAVAPAAVGPGGGMGMSPIDPSEFVTVEMQPYILNLSDEDGNRYLKMSLTVRVRGEEAKERFATLKPAVRDRFIQHITSLRMQDLATAEKKTELKQTLVQKANEVVPRGDVLDVYFTDFVIQ